MCSRGHETSAVREIGEDRDCGPKVRGTITKPVEALGKDNEKLRVINRRSRLAVMAGGARCPGGRRKWAPAERAPPWARPLAEADPARGT